MAGHAGQTWFPDIVKRDGRTGPAAVETRIGVVMEAEEQAAAQLLGNIKPCPATPVGEQRGFIFLKTIHCRGLPSLGRRG